MLNIKDLAASKSLSSKEMSAVHGGFNKNTTVIGGQEQLALGGGFASPVTQVAVGPTVTNAQTDTRVDLSSISNVLGNQKVFAL